MHGHLKSGCMGKIERLRYKKKEIPGAFLFRGFLMIIREDSTHVRQRGRFCLLAFLYLSMVSPGAWNKRGFLCESRDFYAMRLCRVLFDIGGWSCTAKEKSLHQAMQGLLCASYAAGAAGTSAAAGTAVNCSSVTPFAITPAMP